MQGEYTEIAANVIKSANKKVFGGRKMKYEIKGGSFPVVICNLENGEKMITEKGSMAWMSPNMQMETKGGGLGKMFSKAFSGESMFQNHYTARGGAGMIAFTSSFPGEIKAREKEGASVVCLGRLGKENRILSGSEGI